MLEREARLDLPADAAALQQALQTLDAVARELPARGAGRRTQSSRGAQGVGRARRVWAAGAAAHLKPFFLMIASMSSAIALPLPGMGVAAQVGMRAQRSCVRVLQRVAGPRVKTQHGHNDGDRGVRGVGRAPSAHAKRDAAVVSSATATPVPPPACAPAPMRRFITWRGMTRLKPRA